MRYVPICYGEACISQADLIEKCALVMLLSMGALVLLICAGVILYNFGKLFIVLSDYIGAHVYGKWSDRKWIPLAWIAFGFVVLALLGQFWNRGMVPFMFFWAVIYSYIIRPKPR